jgi:peroxiredoxin
MTIHDKNKSLDIPFGVDQNNQKAEKYGSFSFPQTHGYNADGLERWHFVQKHIGRTLQKS